MLTYLGINVALLAVASLTTAHVSRKAVQPLELRPTLTERLGGRLDRIMASGWTPGQMRVRALQMCWRRGCGDYADLLLDAAHRREIELRLERERTEHEASRRTVRAVLRVTA